MAGRIQYVPLALLLRVLPGGRSVTRPNGPEHRFAASAVSWQPEPTIQDRRLSHRRYAWLDQRVGRDPANDVYDRRDYRRLESTDLSRIFETPSSISSATGGTFKGQPFDDAAGR